MKMEMLLVHEMGVDLSFVLFSFSSFSSSSSSPSLSLSSSSFVYPL
jgi:hypothetical protein